jgi:uncharacterized alkaline shock family protein YloU
MIKFSRLNIGGACFIDERKGRSVRNNSLLQGLAVAEDESSTASVELNCIYAYHQWISSRLRELASSLKIINYGHNSTT